MNALFFLLTILLSINHGYPGSAPISQQNIFNQKFVNNLEKSFKTCNCSLHTEVLVGLASTKECFPACLWVCSFTVPPLKLTPTSLLFLHLAWPYTFSVASLFPGHWLPLVPPTSSPYPHFCCKSPKQRLIFSFPVKKETHEEYHSHLESDSQILLFLNF